MAATVSGNLPLVQALRTIQLIADLPEEKLQWLADHGEEQRYPAGEVLIKTGDPADAMYLILEGEMEGRAPDADRAIYQAAAGEITGKLPHSRMQTFPREMRAVTDMRLLKIAERDFTTMLEAVPEMEVRLIRLMADRIREVTAAEVQQSKLAALGKLSAGLAHELNNPASAAARAAGAIREKLREIRDFDCALARAPLSSDQRARLIGIENGALQHAGSCTGLDALTRSDREEEIANLLSDMGVKDPWDLAPELMDAGFDADSLKALSETVDGAFRQALGRIALLIQLDRLAEEVQDSMGRISGLVKSIKEYSYMDTSPEREVDVHKDLENTLRILATKIQKAGVTIERDYDKKLPSVCANGSELNQVWTNLIDNAVDALASAQDGKKVLKVRTALRVDRALIEIADTGPGIPPEIQERIFEPFFTTKKQGQGTGLGLDVVRRIVRRHHGDIVMESKPGATCFQVMLPLKSSAVPR